MVQPWSRPVVRPVCIYRSCYWSSFICLTPSKQSVLKEINPEYSPEGLKLKSQYFGHLMQRADSLDKKKPRCWERLKAGGEGDDRGWDGWMASLTQWTWIGSKLREKVKDRWPSQAIVHEVTKNWTRLRSWTRSAKANTAVLRSAAEKEIIHRSWMIKTAEQWRIDAFELWCWRSLLRVPWTARSSNQSVLKEISPEYSLEGLLLKLKLQAIHVVKDLATEGQR